MARETDSREALNLQRDALLLKISQMPLQPEYNADGVHIDWPALRIHYMDLLLKLDEAIQRARPFFIRSRMRA